MIDSELIERVKGSRAKVDEQKQARLRLEAQKETYLREVSDFKTRLQAEGIDPARLDSLIDQTKIDLEKKLGELETALESQT